MTGGGGERDAASDRGGDLAALRGADDATVYQPAEDSGLLAEAAIEEAHGRVLEVGTGSGWVAERIADERGL
ncbi:methyltransferase, partial [Halorubrum distributum]